MKLFKQIMLRVIFLPLIFAAGLAAAALITLRVMFTPANLQSIMVNQFQQILKRPVQIEWARISYTGEIKIKGLRVVEPSPEAVDFLRADYIYATYRLLPLLQRRLDIDSVVLVSPSITLFKRADGTWNIADILAAYHKPSGRSLLSRIDSAEIKDGKLSVTYLRTGTGYRFENLNATLRGFKPDADTPFDLSVFLKSDSFRAPLEGRLYAEGKLNLAGFNWKDSGIKDLRADLTLKDKTIDFTGDIKGLRQPEISLEAETPSFTGDDVDYLFSAPFKFEAPRSHWKIDAVVSSSRTVETSLYCTPLGLKIDGRIDLSGLVPAYGFTVSVPPLTMDQLRRYGAVIPLQKPSGKAQARIRISSKDGKPVFSRAFINVAGAGFSYRALSVSGLDAAALVTKPVSDSRVTASKGRLALGRNIFSGLRLKAELLKNGFQFDYTGKFDGQAAKGRVLVRRPFTPERSVDYLGYSSDISYDSLKDLVLDIKKLHGPRTGVPEFKSQLAWLKKLKNSIPMGYSSVKLLYKAARFRHQYLHADDFYLSASLKNIAGDISKIKGDISIKSGPGVFYNVQETSEKDHVYYIFSLPLTFIHKMNRFGALQFASQVNDVAFSSIGGDYTLDNGKVYIRNSFITGKQFSAYVTGQLDFNSETMKVKIYTISGKYDTMGSLPEALTDKSGKPALAFTLEGKMKSPEFKMLSAKESGDMISAAARKGVGIDFARINSFAGGKK